MEEEEEEQREGKSKGPDFRWEQRVAHAGARGRTKQNGIQGNIPYFHKPHLLFFRLTEILLFRPISPLS